SARSNLRRVLPGRPRKPASGRSRPRAFDRAPARRPAAARDRRALGRRQGHDVHGDGAALRAAEGRGPRRQDVRADDGRHDPRHRRRAGRRGGDEPDARARRLRRAHRELRARGARAHRGMHAGLADQRLSPPRRRVRSRRRHRGAPYARGGYPGDLRDRRHREDHDRRGGARPRPSAHETVAGGRAARDDQRGACGPAACTARVRTDLTVSASDTSSRLACRAAPRIAATADARAHPDGYAWRMPHRFRNVGALEDKTFLAIVVAVSAAFALVIWPFYGAVLWGSAIAILFAPLHRKILARLHGRPNLAAVATLLVIVAIVIVPLIVIGALLVRQAAAVYEHLEAGSVDFRSYLLQVANALP